NRSPPPPNSGNLRRGDQDEASAPPGGSPLLPAAGTNLLGDPVRETIGESDPESSTARPIIKEEAPDPVTTSQESHDDNSGPEPARVSLPEEDLGNIRNLESVERSQEAYIDALQDQHNTFEVEYQRVNAELHKIDAGKNDIAEKLKQQQQEYEESRNNRLALLEALIRKMTETVKELHQDARQLRSGRVMPSRNLQ
ncbi:MAG: hypothetical protein Q9180_009439, partial [Flavoplaca navasiana]